MTEAQQAAITCIGLIDMHRYRNGHSSVQNLYADKLITVIEEAFDVKRVNVNDLLIADPVLRAYFDRIVS